MIVKVTDQDDLLSSSLLLYQCALRLLVVLAKFVRRKYEMYYHLLSLALSLASMCKAVVSLQKHPLIRYVGPESQYYST